MFLFRDERVTMTQAIVLHQKSVCQIFKEWATQKGVDYLKGKSIEDHLGSFGEECGLVIRRHLAHELIARLVRQGNRKASDSKIRVGFFYLRPSLRGHFRH